MASKGPFTLDQMKAAIHKSAAGAQGQAAQPQAAGVPGTITSPSSAVHEDLGVLAQQAAQYQAGAVAGTAAAQFEREQAEAGGLQQMEQAETARREAIRNDQEQHALQQQLAAERTRLQIQQEQQRAALAVAEDNARAANARRARAIQAAAMQEEARERAAANAARYNKELAEMRDHAMANTYRSIQREHGDEHMEVFNYIANRAETFGEAQQVINTMARNDAFSRGGPAQNIRMDIIMKDLRKLYQSGANFGAR